MSKINGDKARFHVARKQNIKRRAKTRDLLLSLAGATGTSPAKKAPKASAAKAKKVG
jgi:hypothetical protein